MAMIILYSYNVLDAMMISYNIDYHGYASISSRCFNVERKECNFDRGRIPEVCAKALLPPCIQGLLSFLVCITNFTSKIDHLA